MLRSGGGGVWRAARPTGLANGARFDARLDGAGGEALRAACRSLHRAPGPVARNGGGGGTCCTPPGLGNRSALAGVDAGSGRLIWPHPRTPAVPVSWFAPVGDTAEGPAALAAAGPPATPRTTPHSPMLGAGRLWRPPWPGASAVARPRGANATLKRARQPGHCRPSGAGGREVGRCGWPPPCKRQPRPKAQHH